MEPSWCMLPDVCFWSLGQPLTLLTYLKDMPVTRSLYIYGTESLFKYWDEIFHDKRYRCLIKEILEEFMLERAKNVQVAWVANDINLKCYLSSSCCWRHLTGGERLRKKWLLLKNSTGLEFSHFSGMIISPFFFASVKWRKRKKGKPGEEGRDASLVFQMFFLIAKEKVMCRDIPDTVGLSCGGGASNTDWFESLGVFSQPWLEHEIYGDLERCHDNSVCPYNNVLADNGLHIPQWSHVTAKEMGKAYHPVTL